MSRHGSIFYDAPEPHGSLSVNEEKDELSKLVNNSKANIVKNKSYFFFSSYLMQSDSEASSYGDDDSHAGDMERQISIPPPISTHQILLFN